MRNLRLALLFGPCLLSAGCAASLPLAPGAKNVTLTHQESDVATCTPLGKVFGLTDTNYVTDERREMQNEAMSLGADTVLLTRGRDPPEGTAYRCSSAVTEGNH